MKEIRIREISLKVLTLEGERLLLIGGIIEDFMKILALLLDFIKQGFRRLGTQVKDMPEQKTINQHLFSTGQASYTKWYLNSKSSP